MSTEPAIIVESEQAYHANPAMSRSALWTLYSKTPAHLLAPKEPEQQMSSAMMKGTLTHWAVLQPELIEQRVAVSPDMNKNTNVWKAFVLDATAANKLAVQESDIADILRLRDAAHKNITVQALAKGGLIERSHYWTDRVTGVRMKVRPDIFHPGFRLAADLKTTADASAFAFSRSVANYGYHVQNAVYLEGLRETGMVCDGFVFILVESDAPHVTVVYELDEEAQAEGLAVYRKAIEQYKACLATNTWPGYGDDVRPLSLPAWALRETSAA